MKEETVRAIREGNTALGIEFGSTRIKAVLVDGERTPVASGAYEWENRYENGYWTYSEEEITKGLQACYAALAADVLERYGIELTTIGAIGVSAMMHGYLAFGREGNLLVPFRTWRNNTAAPAAGRLSKAFRFHVPARWSVAHFYQAVLNGEPHVKDIVSLTTLAGYAHWRLTGKKVLGIGDASGMFPVDGAGRYHAGMLETFQKLLSERGVALDVREILPEILTAGERAGTLTEEGARLLDPTGKLRAGIAFCPPEGDAGTGMVATNSVKKRTGNVSAGTSVFAMIVLERGLKRPYEEIDLVATPAGDAVAMVHCNNCTSDINAWVNLFGEFAALSGTKLSKSELFDLLFSAADKGEKDCGGLLSYNCVSGEDITKIEAGRPLFVRTPESRFTLANFMRAQLYSAFAALRTGCEVLFCEEGVKLDSVTAHGGIFKTDRVAQSVLAAALGVPVTVLKTAGEGGAWGMALLADFMLQKRKDERLEDYLAKRVFCGQAGAALAPDPADFAGYEAFAKRYEEGLPVVREAVRSVK